MENDFGFYYDINEIIKPVLKNYEKNYTDDEIIEAFRKNDYCVVETLTYLIYDKNN